MGYTTELYGEFEVNPRLDSDTIELLNRLHDTRRMKRDLTKIMPKASADLFGIEGEFYCVGDMFTHTYDDSVLDINRPPRTQPGLWLQWVYNEELNVIEWDEREKFYHYVAWIQYLIDAILAPRGYVLDGEVLWYGEDRENLGKIIISNNNVLEYRAVISYEEVK